MSHRRAANQRLCALAIAATAIALAACASNPAGGYAFEPVHSTDVRSIAVPIWENRTFYPGAEVELTEAIVKELQRTTDWAVVRTGVAETSLDGAITAIDLETLSIDRDAGLTQEQIVRYRVDFTWIDNRTGQELVRRLDYDGVGSFVPALGSRERIEIGRAAAVDELAQDIVNELQSVW